MIEKKNDVLIKIGILFYLCSIIGYIYENILCLIHNGELQGHGILHGPWLPIYGTGAIMIYFLNKYRRNPILIFVLSFILTGLLEYICGYILFHFFDMRLWDYRGWYLNIDGFVCLLSATCFGIGGLIIIYGLIPLINKVLKKVKFKTIKLVLGGLSILFITDVASAVIKGLLK